MFSPVLSWTDRPVASGFLLDLPASGAWHGDPGESHVFLAFLTLTLGGFRLSSASLLLGILLWGETPELTLSKNQL